MSLQERTLVVRNFDPDKTTNKLLKELCIQAGPVRNVVVKPDHAFVEYEDIESVGYAKALLDGINFHGRKLILEPKVRSNITMRFTQILQDYIKYDKNQRAIQQQQQQQQQQMMMMTSYQQQNYHQPPPQAPQPTFNPTLQFPVNFINNPIPTPQIFSTSTTPINTQPSFSYQHQQPQNNLPHSLPDTIMPLHQPFQVPPRPQQFYQQPSTSFIPNSNNLGRSRSFNHRQNKNNFNRHRSSDWTNRR